MRKLVAIVFMMLLVALTTAPALAESLTVSNVRELAGTWEGYPRDDSRTSTTPTTWTIREDGTYTSAWTINTQGKIQLVGGKLIYESGLTSGTLALEERGGEQLLLLTGKSKSDNQTITIEFVRK